MLVLAHRGASGYAPENTMEAFKKAIELGADGFELDIQMTKDGEIVVIHDEKIDRTSDGKGWVKDYTLEELRRFNFNNHMAEYPHADIPTMREVFELVKPTNLVINIEIKTGIVFYPIEEKILALTKEMGMEDRVFYSSFNHYTATKIHELNPNTKVGFLYADGPIDMPSYGEKHGVNALHPALYNLQYPGFVEECKKKGLKLHVWTVNEEEYVKMCVAAQVDSVITNYPDMARRVINENS
ncbi:MAG: glycerophosphodiester phosphodiesterase [Lachnospiraceae bacterium]|nr:glycerophosphodiester phosphodiesterase [Lachnospiraceae bacterium]